MVANKIRLLYGDGEYGAGSYPFVELDWDMNPMKAIIRCYLDLKGEQDE